MRPSRVPVAVDHPRPRDLERAVLDVHAAAAPGTARRATRRRGGTGRAAAASDGRPRRAPTSSRDAASRARRRGSSRPPASRAAGRARAGRRRARGTGWWRGRSRRGRSARRAAAASRRSSRCRARSAVAYSAGRRNGTSAPYQRATLAIASLSVETTIRSKTPLWRAVSIAYASSGCPASGRTFLPGTRSEPARAPMSATALGIAPPRGAPRARGVGTPSRVTGPHAPSR